MPDFRAYCRPSEPEPRELQLSPDESHHLITVNRARPGSSVIAFDGQGTEWTCELTSASRTAASLRVLSTLRHPALPFHLTLGQSLPKGSTMDDIVRRATELGTTCIVPLESERTQVHLDGQRQDKKIDKWRTAALEAAKQCGNPWLPEIAPIQRADHFITATKTSAPAYDLKLIASLHPGARSLKNALADFRATHTRAPHRVLWLVGPEGDFSPAEMAHALAHGFTPITLGPLVLRCETAAISALSILTYELFNTTAPNNLSP